MTREKFIDAALGREKAELVIKNARVVDVFCGKVTEASVAISDGVIVGVGDYEGVAEYDAKGGYIMPGFIDSHVHIESSMVTPAEYARCVLPRGTTTAICDPHEIANVAGLDGILYMMESAKTSPMDFKFMLSSCVPAAEFEDAGAVITAEDTSKFMEKYDFLGLAEMMNYPGLFFKDKEVLKKLDCAEIIDGHAPSVSGKELMAYAGSGISTDHECTSAKEMEEKISAGMYALLRCGRMSREFSEMASAVDSHTANRIAFCTDDRNLADIVKSGSVQNCIVTAVNAGMDIITAIKAATINAAECYKLKNVGAIAPGYKADIVLSQELCPKQINAVWKNGELIAESGAVNYERAPALKREGVYNSVNIKEFKKEELVCPFSKEMPVIKIEEGSLATKIEYKDSSDGLSHLAVIERHNATGKIGTCYLDGYEIKNGAVASCIGHDSHNLIIAGDNAEDMYTAAEALGKEGGVCVVSNGVVKARLTLSVGGLMSDRSADEVIKEHDIAENEAKALGVNPNIDPIMTLAFLSLPVIPEIRLTARGLFDVTKFDFVANKE